MSAPARAGDVEVAIAGERLRLCPERAAYWPATRTLLVADPHWGKAAAFRAGGIPVPGGTTAGGLRRLDALLAAFDVEQLVFLGDFLHARAGRTAAVFGALSAWRARHASLEVVLVRGNHDRGAGDPPTTLGLRCVDAPLAMPPFALAHLPEPSDDRYVLAGHLHPGVVLTGAGRQRERLPCFWFGARVGVLAAFGEFTGLATVKPTEGDRVVVVAGDRLVDTGRS